MNTRVVYLIEQPLDPRNYRRFGIQAWLDRNWITEVWDLTPWAQPRSWESFRALGLPLAEFGGYFPIESRQGLRERLASLPRVHCYIDLTGDNYCTVQAKWGLRRRGAMRVVCAVGTIPVAPPEANNRLVRLAKRLADDPRKSPQWLSAAFFARVVTPRLSADMAVLSGESSRQLARNCRMSIPAHNFDYDIYLQLRESTGTAAQRYAVFLDQDYCFHPEFIERDEAVATPERYFPAVRNGLAAIGARLGVKVLVAAHPRATYRQRGGECFGSLPIEYGRTAELVKDAAAVICHDSTAIQFAVLFNKPLIFLTTHELQRVYEGRSIIQVASELGKRPINVDSEDLAAVDWQHEMRIDPVKYAAYIRRYIKMNGSPDVPLWDIVIDHIQNAANGGGERCSA